MVSKIRTPLSDILPPLICGTATFNDQYNNTDPFLLPTTSIVHSAFTHGIRAFDTSPYYGPAEELLGRALATEFVREKYPRSSYHILTKVGRIAGSEFNYSKEWVKSSVERSLKRLQTEYLDVVYCHDVEFVSTAEVLEAVQELRRIRDEEGTIKYVGISGYPVDVLCELSELILKETGEPLDIVMNYANYTIQNTTLLTKGVERLRKAGVEVVPNASVLGMGLLRQAGVPIGRKGDFHPAPNDLRAACHAASELCASKGEKLEVVAIRWGLESWLEKGAAVGSRGDPASGVEWKQESIQEVGNHKLGISVMGVSNIPELEETLRVWRSVLDGMEEGGKERAVKAGRKEDDHVWSLERKKTTQGLVEEIWGILGQWKDYAWASPDEEYLAIRKASLLAEPVKIGSELLEEKSAGSQVREVVETSAP